MELTTNQLILLLNVHRGTHEKEKDFATYEADIKVLLSLMLISNPYPDVYTITLNGVGLISSAKVVTVDPDITQARLMLGKQFRHTNGSVYTVIDATNLDTTRKRDHPIYIQYIGKNGKKWSRQLSDWNRSFTLVENDDPNKYNQTYEAPKNDR